MKQTKQSSHRPFLVWLRAFVQVSCLMRGYVLTFRLSSNQGLQREKKAATFPDCNELNVMRAYVSRSPNSQHSLKPFVFMT